MTEHSNKNNVWDGFQTLMDKIHKEVEIAARKKQTDKLLEVTDWLRRAKELEIRHTELLKQIDKLIFERCSPKDENLTVKKLNDNEINFSNRSGGKARAGECRSAYIEQEKKRGNLLKWIRGSYFKNAAGLTIGITWSFQDKDKRCPWFFNLRESQFDEAVLLCEINKEAVQVIHLPKTFFDRYTKQMSRGKKGRIIFNVGKWNGNFSLQLPSPTGWIDVSNYTENEPLVCPHLEFV
jgi:hypothetical protein